MSGLGKMGLVSGHGFSRADEANKMTWALAHEGRTFTVQENL
jgi:hypothetical protein